ncbi:MAG: amidohydrolase [Deltaproteobacteria bacterium]|nr:MAG: amidohydrolase [Deltaproteobacteria bacterium]
MSILIKNVLVNGETADIRIRETRIAAIATSLPQEDGDELINGANKAAIPGFVNGHTHAAMTLFRGFADDMELKPWLETKIWPAEAKLTEEDVYAGTRLACLEMIKTGTTLFNDMYWHLPGAVRAVESMGIRAVLSAVFIDLFDPNKRKEQVEENLRYLEMFQGKHPLIQIALGPHAIYTVSREALEWVRDTAESRDLPVHIHLSETKQEVDDCLKAHGMRPVEYLDDIGLLSDRLFAAHCNHLTEGEMDLLARSGAHLVHNPVSNMKLTVGDIFPYKALAERGASILLGTDGCSSNNNLDMLETAKFASLFQKWQANDPTLMPAGEALDILTKEGYKAFRVGKGTLAPGEPADVVLIDLDHPQNVPLYHLDSNLIYAVNGTAVSTTICNGKVLMKDGIVPDEDAIIAEARKTAKKFAGMP